MHILDGSLAPISKNSIFLRYSKRSRKESKGVEKESEGVGRSRKESEGVGRRRKESEGVEKETEGVGGSRKKSSKKKISNSNVLLHLLCTYC